MFLSPSRLLCIVFLLGLVGPVSEQSLKLYPVKLPLQSPRLLGMSMDDDGYLWFGSTHRKIYHYDPRSGQCDEIPLPFDSSTSQTICVGPKVYLLGQTYPKLMIYDRVARTFSEKDYPTPAPDVWYGTDLVEGKFLYLFDRGSAGIIRWNTATDTGEPIAYPYKTPLPGFGRYVAADGAVWCGAWDFADGQYVPLGIARLDVAKNAFTGWFPFPSEDAGGEPFTDPSSTLFYPHTLRGKLVPFDTRQCKWRKPIAAPGFGTRFGFIGLASIHDGRWYFSISTYNGTPTGCDGQPYHFCNALMEFDPRTSEFAFPTLDVKDSYYQVSYHLSASGQLFATGNNIRQGDGSLDQSKPGEIIVWQTKPVANLSPGE